jgi:hypothetical protein
VGFKPSLWIMDGAARPRKNERRHEVCRASPSRRSNAAARKLVEIDERIEAAQDGPIYIERVDEPFLKAGGRGEQFRAVIERASHSAGYSGTLSEVYRPRCGFPCLSSAPADPFQHAKHCVAGGFGVHEGFER